MCDGGRRGKGRGDRFLWPALFQTEKKKLDVEGTGLGNEVEGTLGSGLGRRDGRGWSEA